MQLTLPDSRNWRAQRPSNRSRAWRMAHIVPRSPQPRQMCDGGRKQVRQLALTVHVTSAAMGAASSKAGPVPELQGTATACAPSARGRQCRRVCVGVAGGSRGAAKRVCAVAERHGKRAACADACACACDRLLLVPFAHGVGMWWRARERAAGCRRDCVPACDQPGRVAKSEFSAPLW